MLVYFYSELEPHEYLTSREAFTDPVASKREGKPVYGLPACATFTEPPEALRGYVRCFNEATAKWEQIEDHRGTKYWMPGATYGTPAEEMRTVGPLPEGASTTAPEKSREQKLAALLPAVQAALDAFARTKDYDSIDKACSYALSSDATYKAEGLYAVALRDNTWKEAIALYNTLQSGTGGVLSVDEFIAQLPVANAVWPTNG